MQHITDGGSAFPAGDPVYGTSGGMSLRDYFAAKALLIIVNDQAQRAAMTNEADHRGILISDAVALAAYEIADAMLRARSAQFASRETS